MRINVKSVLLAGAATVALLTVAPAANATTINFNALAPGTAVTNQFAGVVFSLIGGPDSGGAPTTGYAWFDSGFSSLANSHNTSTTPGGASGYDTANILDIAFSSPVSSVLFTFNNYGSGNGSNYQAFGPGASLISSGDLSNVNGFTVVSVSGSGITDLQLNNGSGGGNSWIFGVGSLSYSAVPETSTWVMMLAGFAGLGFAGYRRSKTLPAA
jgi:hypothetical protein